MDANPYESPEAELIPGTARGPSVPGNLQVPVPAGAVPAPAVSTQGTIGPRYFAASADNALAIVASLMAAGSISEEMQGVQALALVATYLGYFFVCEALFAGSIGKLLAGLVIVQCDGRRCTAGQAFLRTLFRVLEVNPLLLGALPAAVTIVVSKHHQRLGDKAAGTVVVLKRML